MKRTTPSLGDAPTTSISKNLEQQPGNGTQEQAATPPQRSKGSYGDDPPADAGRPLKKKPPNKRLHERAWDGPRLRAGPTPKQTPCLVSTATGSTGMDSQHTEHTSVLPVGGLRTGHSYSQQNGPNVHAHTRTPGGKEAQLVGLQQTPPPVGKDPENRGFGFRPPHKHSAGLLCGSLSSLKLFICTFASLNAACCGSETVGSAAALPVRGRLSGRHGNPVATPPAFL